MNEAVQMPVCASAGAIVGNVEADRWRVKAPPRVNRVRRILPAVCPSVVTQGKAMALPVCNESLTTGFKLCTASPYDTDGSIK